MKRTAGFLCVFLLVLASTVLLSSCQGAREAGPARKTVAIGLVAKNKTNPVFLAAYAGAQEAALQLGRTYGVNIDLRWETPIDENPQLQAMLIEKLARDGVQGIAVSCSDANLVTPAINKAAGLGARVMCFDSDAPDSRRFCFYGTDDYRCGQAIVQELAAVMGGQGTIAILAGSREAPNLRQRLSGVLAELPLHPGLKLLKNGVFYNPEMPAVAAETVNSAQGLHPEITGWAMIGGWPFMAQNTLNWVPGETKVVAMDALPIQLGYIEAGYVQTLFAQDCHGWGYRSVQILLDKIVRNQDPGQTVIYSELTKATRNNLKNYSANWKRWLSK